MLNPGQLEIDLPEQAFPTTLGAEVTYNYRGNIYSRTSRAVDNAY